MKRRTIIGILIAYVLIMVVVYTALLRGHTVALFSPEGTIAAQEKSLIIFTVLLGCTIVIPVLVMTFAIAWHYRESNGRAKYRPEWSGSLVAEGIWWVIPAIVIGVLAVVINTSTHQLDPYKALASSEKPLNVQVVALQWRWLFIYPDQKIASINYLKIPKDTPVNFTITSDAPMNSFWIPQLSGQVYAMSGMSTQLHLAADTVGDYRGSSANISGLGFAGMKFDTSVATKADFATWTTMMQGTSPGLDAAVYNKMAKSTLDESRQSFALMDSNLYNEIINKYEDPDSNATIPTTTKSAVDNDAVATPMTKPKSEKTLPTDGTTSTVRGE